VATPAEILTTLKTLTDAYPGQHIKKSALQVYLDNLADLPAWLLDQAARRHLRSSAWFPKISELRDIAALIAGSHDFAGLEAPTPDLLYRESRRLEEAFYCKGHFDRHEWDRLAVRYDQAGRTDAAEACRQKLAVLLQLQRTPPGRIAGDAWALIAEAQDLEDAFFAEGRLEAAEWRDLSARFARLDRSHRAEYTLEKLRRLEIVREQQACPPLSVGEGQG
jgi:hypothetical protein